MLCTISKAGQSNLGRNARNESRHGWTDKASIYILSVLPVAGYKVCLHTRGAPHGNERRTRPLSFRLKMNPLLSVWSPYCPGSHARKKF